jgi:diguanylate cyclase (GGDEF)-like protein
MQNVIATALRGALLTVLYFVGAVVAVLYLRTPADVTLFWPAAGIGYALVLRYGLRYALVIPAAQMLVHLLAVPVPPAFLPFSLASNYIGTVAACAYVASRQSRLQLRIADGFLLLRGGILLSMVSALIGAAGMLAAGMAPTADLPRVLLQWALGDLLGATAITPFLLLLFARNLQVRLPVPSGASPRERLFWSMVMLLVLVAGFFIILGGSLYPLSIATLPLALLLWSAARYPPLFTAGATMAVTLVLALGLGLGLGGTDRPVTLHDTALMMGTLVVYSVVPVLLVASYNERAHTVEALRVRATIDPLTGLLNRDAFEELARTRLAHSTEAQTLLYVDLDNFKLVNDAASHAAGDEALRHVAALVREAFDSEALVAHSSGDEFTILAPQDAVTAITAGRRLLTAIEELRVVWQGGTLRTTASIGIAASLPPHASFDHLLSQVDTACHEAKELGGNRLLVAGQNVESLRSRSRMMRHALDAREALDQRRFELWCQPIVNLRTPGAVQTHFEILLRWRDSDGRLRAPADMIAAAERYRLGPRLDRHVLDAVLDWLEVHPAAAAQIGQCSINLGAATLADDEFADYAAGRLRRSPLEPGQLCLEITETSVVRDLNRTRRFIARMRELGCQFALDDFGTGFCSFGYLRDLQVDYLKIDGGFVRDLTESRLSEAVVRSITEIAHLLDIRAVGEQVETEAQLQRLQALQVDYAQGYVFQQPVPIADFFGLPSG